MCSSGHVLRRSELDNRLKMLVHGKVKSHARNHFIRPIQQNVTSGTFRIAVKDVAQVSGKIH